MRDHDSPTESQVAALDGGVAELVGQDEVVGWVAVKVEPFRNLIFSKRLGCWLLFTWADGAVELEEDYPPYRLVPELLSGTLLDEQGAVLTVRWVSAEHRDDQWQRYGIHHPAGHYMGHRARHNRAR